MSALMSVLWVVLWSGSAEAHPSQASAVLLDVGASSVSVELRIPWDQLQMAMADPATGAPVAGALPPLPALGELVAAHFLIMDGAGAPFDERRTSVAWQNLDGLQHLVVVLEQTPPRGGDLSAFTVHDDLVLAEVPTHKIYVSLRRDFALGLLGEDPQLLGVLGAGEDQLLVDRRPGSALHGSAWRGFTAIFKLGMEHIAHGTDHLLFLLTLLLVAPARAQDGLWLAAPAVRPALRRIVGVVTAFTVGHSLTLALAATGLVQLPGPPIELLIACSITLSAVHAARPLLPRKEHLVAGLFGLVHGLAFASALSGLGLDAGGLLLGLLGFNLGIEVMQLAVVAVTVPPLLLLARTRAYGPVRVIGAIIAGIASVFWIVERLGALG